MIRKKMTFQLSPTSISDVLPCVCVCVMCLCNICIDVKRLTQGGTGVTLLPVPTKTARCHSDIKRRRPFDVPAVFPPFVFRSSWHGAKPRTPRPKSSSFSWSSCCMVSANHFSDHFLFVSCNWNTCWHADRCVKWTSRGMRNKTWQTTIRFLQSAFIVTCNCFHSPYFLGWRKRMIQFTRKKNFPLISFITFMNSHWHVCCPMNFQS